MKLLKLLFAGLLFTSCSSVAHLQTDDIKQNYPATNAEQIAVFSTDKVDQEYSVIGVVIANTDAGTDASVSVKQLKKQAAKLGADAIIDLRLEISYGYWATAIKATGIAVKFNNQ